MSPEPIQAELPDASSIKSKGFTLRGALAFADQTYGADARERLFAALDEEARTILSGQVLASAWYPFRTQVALYEAIDRVFGAGDLALCRQIGRFTAEFELSTIHRMTLKLSSLSIWLRTASLMWGQYYSAGKLRNESFSEGSGRLVVTDFNPVHKAFCADLSGWFERTAELSGKRRVTVTHPECLLDGRAACVYQATWES